MRGNILKRGEREEGEECDGSGWHVAVGTGRGGTCEGEELSWRHAWRVVSSGTVKAATVTGFEAVGNVNNKDLDEIKKKLQMSSCECDGLREKRNSHPSNFFDATRRTLSAAASQEDERSKEKVRQLVVVRAFKIQD
ncbi:unnamed protein product [Sphenostylis stenocarpa]|uniref:Uncharacterized protein n=1 Tax=Sphenostylis stenocarpa TaxID=92480 RepID=A0AA86SCJ4_9FABA|nr:unnamed protein product [Sphenostylis stenocarpa]